MKIFSFFDLLYRLCFFTVTRLQTQKSVYKRRKYEDLCCNPFFNNHGYNGLRWLQKRQKEVKKVERSEIDELAYKRSELGKRSNPEERLYWIVMIGVYAYARTKFPSDKDKSVDFKNKVIGEMDKLLEKAQAEPIERAFFEINIKATQILDKLIQPRAQLANKSKQELIDLICRYEAALSGMLNEYDESVPEFFKIRVNEEE